MSYARGGDSLSHGLSSFFFFLRYHFKKSAVTLIPIKPPPSPLIVLRVDYIFLIYCSFVIWPAPSPFIFFFKFSV